MTKKSRKKPGVKLFNMNGQPVTGAVRKVSKKEFDGIFGKKNPDKVQVTTCPKCGHKWKVSDKL